MSRKERGSELTSIAHCVAESIQGREDYIKKSKDRLVTAASNRNNNIRTNRKTTKTRKQKCEGKKLCGYFKQRTSEIAHEKTWTWLRKGNLKRETESLLIAVQKNSIRPNYVQIKIDKMQ